MRTVINQIHSGWRELTAGGRLLLASFCASGALLCIIILSALWIAQAQGKIFVEGYFPGAFSPNPTAFTGGVLRPRGATIWGLTTENSLRILRPNAQDFRRDLPIKGLLPDEHIIGIDWRPSDNSLYVVGDTGNIYLLATITNRGALASLQSPANRSPRFDGGVQSLADFNPLLINNGNPLRLIGSNDQNFAVVNAAGNLDATVAQNPVKYVPAILDANGQVVAPGDANAGTDPNIVGGAYTNSISGATQTTFYAIDFALDTLVTPLLNAQGSSNTGGGLFQTIGRITGPNGALLNFTPTTDLDIYTTRNADGSLTNILIGVTAGVLFSIDLARINPALPVGQTQTVIATGAPFDVGGMIDLVVTPGRLKGESGQGW